ncbi:ABC transporter ATP-binding protein [Haloarchaeobius litoreus]|uniref:ATP-binding cassette domain-containing protein n=1 Tax=Haloarchaeobius litoreus TaxID=755306 RepID=A0ABD6DMN6_9EURY|nr:ABC transporter ATP-binding protein [Haloarchaeobius litoreus]
MTAIETDGLTKRYGDDVFAVNELSLTVAEGEVFGFLGPNGSGKSTTIDMLLDYVRPTAGSASVLGYDAQTEAEEIHQRVGILPDGYSLYDRLTGRKHVDFAISLKRTDDDPDAILRRVGLDADAASRPAGTYSKGMRQRLALGMALVGDPDLLILDEPSSGLDPDGIRDIRELTLEHARNGGTVFFSSHILSQVEAVCDRVGILNRGRLVAVDTIDGLRDSLGTGATITVTVDEVPAEHRLADLAGVSGVLVDGDEMEVTCTDPATKLAVLDRLRETGTRILDFDTNKSSLEDLFSAYTHGDDTRRAIEAQR